MGFLGGLSDPGIKSVSPELAGRFFTTEPADSDEDELNHLQLSAEELMLLNYGVGEDS